MLQRLMLSQFVIVRQAEIEFGPGFTALTGETGAGKSILLDALGLVLGARADPSLIAEGASRAQISAEFSSNTALDAHLTSLDLQGDGGVILLRRTLESDGKSRAFINGHPVTLTQMRELGDQLVDIHGQHASQALMRPAHQRTLVDAFAGHAPELESLARTFEQWQERQAWLDKALSSDREMLLERDRLRWRIEELEALRPKAGEWESLAEEQKRLAHAAELIELASGASAVLHEDDASVSSVLAGVAGRARQLVQIDARLEPILQMIESAQAQVAEAASDLATYAQRIDLDPQRLSQVEQRLTTLHDCARKLRIEPEMMAQELEAVGQALQALDAAQDTEALRAEVQALKSRYVEQAKRLSKQRKQAARKLAKSVSATLERLSMAGSQLQIDFAAGEPAPHGMDQIDFKLAGHTGTQARSIAKVASGGELSRIGLAISVAAAKVTNIASLIFDEADAGVGGAVAQVIGDLMRELGQEHQVLCVTHLPQVAARAHQQLRVSKQREGDAVISEVTPLARDARIEEIARMLGGVEITPITRRHARELLAY
jgi:DNA repair protein RecN (Recombination protein N)